MLNTKAGAASPAPLSMRTAVQVLEMLIRPIPRHMALLSSRVEPTPLVAVGSGWGVSVGCAVAVGMGVRMAVSVVGEGEGGGTAVSGTVGGGVQCVSVSRTSIRKSRVTFVRVMAFIDLIAGDRKRRAPLWERGS